MKFTDADRVERRIEGGVRLYKAGTLFAILTNPEAEVILKDNYAYITMLEEEWSAKIDAEVDALRLAYLEECKRSR